MRWEIVPTNVANLLEFQLIDEGVARVTLKYNTVHHTVRIYTNAARRVFFLEQHAGILRSKTIFKNEYGIEVGKLNSDKWHSSTYSLELSGKKYHIGYRNNPLAELVVYSKNINEPLVTCGLKISDGKAVIKTEAQENDEMSSLLLGLCWYLFMPVAKENVIMFAATA